ncbi:MAG: aliphatic sulfonate ABC transporter substrate-binding protein [Methylococcus sp.]|nr:aliphatic sulfonate ABC transporter substrate-binding protein [Methylococcus sp.]
MSKANTSLASLFALAFILYASCISSVKSVESENAQPASIRIGYQKYGTLILVKARGELDRRLKQAGVTVDWAEFAFGPPMLEALNAAHLDFAASGETPPVFALAAKGSDLIYLGYESASPEGEAILVAKDSGIGGISELKGRKVAVARGSNAHYLLIRALASAGLDWKDIQPVYLAPADARAAFANGTVDAWAIWDFHLAAIQELGEARILADGKQLVQNYEIYTSRRDFIRQHPDLAKTVLEEIARTDEWAKTHTAEAAELLDRQLGIGVGILQRALGRRAYGLHPADTELANSQQNIADTLHALGLLPKPVQVSLALSATEIQP